ncbi:MAG TPA: hypothetical protein VKR31_07995 [Rhizomicrobium sp.]|nr:hypothetical protein [Rhizomicrobium sp.]
MRLRSAIVRLVSLGRTMNGLLLPDSSKQIRNRDVDEIVARFKEQLGPGGKSSWEVREEMHDERGLPH